MGSADGEETMQGLDSRGEDRILVSVRLRPLNEKEILRNEVVDWECINDTTIIYKNHLSPERSMYPTSYTFDRVFRCDCSTRQVYEKGAKAVVLSVVNGINSSVFAYGQTSSGKTFTMSGITEYTMEDIFDYIQKHKEREFHLKFSAMEIYNESVRDLLTSDNSPLRLLDDPERGTVVEKLTEETLLDWSHFKELLAVCEAQRQIGETFLNEASSRSHQILRLTIQSSTREFLGNNNSGTLAATLNFVDLAGSERASQALSAGSRLKEGSHINRSLLTLGTVIRKLSKGRTGHIPFRDSKLTRILQSSLGGNAITAIICTMSPARSYVEQSRNTLLFASCAKEITTNACVNVVMSDKALVKHLQRELARLQTVLGSSSPSIQANAVDVLREKDSKIEELERHVRQLTARLNLALSQIHDLQQVVGDRSPTILEEDTSYHTLYGRQVSESSPSDANTVRDRSSFIPSSPVFGTPHSPDRHSRVSYDENYSVSDFEENILPSSPSEQMYAETPGDASPSLCIQTPKIDGNGCRQVRNGLVEKTNLSEVDSSIVSQETFEQSPNSYEAVSCQVSEEVTGPTPETSEVRLPKVHGGCGSHSPYFVAFDPHHVLDEIGEQSPDSDEHDQHQVSQEIAEETLDDCHIDPHHAPDATRQHTDQHLEDRCKEVQCIESKITDNVQTKSAPPAQGELLLTGHEDDDCKENESRQETVLNNMNAISLQVAKEQPGKQQTIDSLECKNLNHAESRSCQSDDTSCRSSTSTQKVKYEMKTVSEAGGDDCIVTLETQMLSAPGHAVDYEIPQRSAGDIELDEISLTDIKVSNHIDNAESFTFDAKRKDIADGPELTKQLPDYQCEDSTLQGNKSTKCTKDVGLNPQYDLGTGSSWLFDSKKLQREIIDLWDTCNVSLVHRTYFFLLFINGKSADTIYMEVERRRLSFVKDAFSWGNSVVLDGWKLTPGSSKRSLHHEREKLAKLMKRRLSSQERIDLYVKWGISLDSKRRSSQLAHRLWTDTADADHILDSANIVAGLVRFSEPQVPTEVFGLNLMTKQAQRKSFRW